MSVGAAVARKPRRRGSVPAYPYAQFARFLEVADQAATHSAEEPIDTALTECLGSRSGRSEVRQALVALGLLDERQKSTTVFFRFCREPASRTDILRRLLEQHYEAALEALKSGADRSRIQELVSTPQHSPRTSSRAVSFFLDAAEFVGHDVSRTRRSHQARISTPPGHPAQESVTNSLPPDYEFLLRRGLDRILADNRITEPVVFEQFEKLCDRYERWVTRTDDTSAPAL